MRRLVAVSNRVGPIRGGAVAGGLAVGLLAALRESRGLWFGWSGELCETAPETPRLEAAGGLTAATLDLPARDFDAYYNGFANRCLWPLFHFRIDLLRYDRQECEAYRRINTLLASRLAPLLRPDDLVWVHDYHLFPLGNELRTLGAMQRIGFFLHTPFPPADLLETLPNHSWLVQCLFEYDVVGFQTEPDVQRFCEYIERLGGGSVRNSQVTAWGRTIEVRAFPIGIDAQPFHDLAFSPGGEREFRHMRESLRGRDQIIGVDRLDYSKGLLRRLAAYELLLERYPDARGRIEFLQIAPISRGDVKAYRDFRIELEQMAAHINGRYARVDWTPVRYLNRAIPRRALAAIHRASRIGLVTPMRDGMNLVAKEYVAAQDPADPGVLVLSRFAGAAQQMKRALLVNPYDPADVAAALQQARSMSLEERQKRHAELMRGLLEHDVTRWRREFIARLGAARRTPRLVERSGEVHAAGC